jgi:transposase-like protein
MWPWHIGQREATSLWDDSAVWSSRHQHDCECETKNHRAIHPGTRVYTDEYSIYARLCVWGYDHKHVNHGRGEYARDEDGDGFCEVHVNTMEGFWSLLRSWLRPHRGISQEKLPLYLGFFEFVHNARKRGKALLHALIELLVT